MEDVFTDSTARPDLDANGMLKRKRSTSPDRSLPVKVTKTLPGANIDFLASIQVEPLPLVDTDDSLRFVQYHFEQYSGVIERHESLAANLGAKLQAPNAIKRFERMFMSPIKILANHGKDTNTVTWLDIVKFYEKQPAQFKIHQKEGEKVYQFYTKQCRVEITADDFEYIQSGQPQKVMPTGTVPADEEKELGAIEFLETKIGQINKLADQVSSRGRQLMSRLKARRNALAARRDVDVNGAASEGSPVDPRPNSPISGFTAVNSQRDASVTNGGVMTTSSFSKPLVSAQVKSELSAIFASSRDRGTSGGADYPLRITKPRNRVSDYAAQDNYYDSPASMGKPQTPAAGATPTSRPTPAEKVDNDGPYRVEMLQRMERMKRYTIVKPPCDRCRRLQIDCQKNLTACLGCTKKHAKCSWKEVTKQELIDNPPPKLRVPSWYGNQVADSSDEEGKNHNPAPVLDKELLGEDSEDEENEIMDTEGSLGREDHAPTRNAGLNGITSGGDHEDAAGALGMGSSSPPADNAFGPGSREALASPPISPRRADAADSSLHQGSGFSASGRAERSGTGSSREADAESAPGHSSTGRADQSGHADQHSHSQRRSALPGILGDEPSEKSASLASGSVDGISRDGRHTNDRFQAEELAPHQQSSPGGLNGMAKV